MGDEGILDFPSRGGGGAWWGGDEGITQEGGGAGEYIIAVEEKGRLDENEACALDALLPVATAALTSKILKQVRTSAKFGGDASSCCKLLCCKLADLLLERERVADAISM